MRSAKSQTKCSFRPAPSFSLLRFPRDIYKSLRFHTKRDLSPVPECGRQKSRARVFSITSHGSVNLALFCAMQDENARYAKPCKEIGGIQFTCLGTPRLFHRAMKKQRPCFFASSFRHLSPFVRGRGDFFCPLAGQKIGSQSVRGEL